MTRAVLLNNLDHRELRVDTARGAELGDAVMSALTFPGEFRNLQAHYPIVFQKDAQGTFAPVALFGLQAGQNLFLRGGRWDAHYLPLAIRRQPFLLGSADGAPVLHIDLDSPRVSRDGRGEALFLEHGGTTPFLDGVASLMRSLHDGVQATPGFVAALLRHELLESFVLDVTGADDSQHRLSGFYTIDEERLGGLDAAALHALARAGWLEPVYMAIASLSQLRALIERREATHAAAR